MQEVKRWANGKVIRPEERRVHRTAWRRVGAGGESRWVYRTHTGEYVILVAALNIRDQRALKLTTVGGIIALQG